MTEQVIRPGRRCNICIEYAVDLDAVPGWGYAPDDWINLATEAVVRQSHYNTSYVVHGIVIDGVMVDHQSAGETSAASSAADGPQ
jgi:hypothetical protein